MLVLIVNKYYRELSYYPDPIFSTYNSPNHSPCQAHHTTPDSLAPPKDCTSGQERLYWPIDAKRKCQIRP